MPISADPEVLTNLIQSVLRNPYANAAREAYRRLPGAGAMDLPFWVDWWRHWHDPIGSGIPLHLIAYIAPGPGPEGEAAAVAAATARRIVDLGKAGLPIDEGAAELACRVRATRRSLDMLVGFTPVMNDVRRLGWSAAFGERLDLTQGLRQRIRKTPVLIVGEPGTGKELLARSLLLASPGAFTDGEWIPAIRDAVNLAGLPSDLVAGALFGHVAGAYSGAVGERQGLLERCQDGAVFLDEVADLPPRAQVGLLRCLQEGKVRRLGANEDRVAAPRILSATHRDLDRLVARDRFRIDLYHRLNAVVIEMPPLRARRSDIMPLADHLRGDLPPDAWHIVRDGLKALLAGHAADHPWPGNVRELIAVLHALALGIAPRLMMSTAQPLSEEMPSGLRDCEWTDKQVRGWYAARAMKHHQTRTAAAKALDIHRNTLAERLREAPDE